MICLEAETWEEGLAGEMSLSGEMVCEDLEDMPTGRVARAAKELREVCGLRIRR